MGAKEVSSFPGLKNYDANRYQFTHIQGGTIMGSSPAHSVVNPYLQHWQVPNLFVLGASAFPQKLPGPSYAYYFGAYLPHCRCDRGSLFEESIGIGVKLGGRPMLSPHTKAGAPSFSRSVREGGAFS